jgi:hypothetical protein
MTCCEIFWEDEKETGVDECELCGYIGSHDPKCVLNRYNLEAGEEEPEK